MCAIARERQTGRERQRQTDRDRDRQAETDSIEKKKANKKSVICSTMTKYKDI